MGDHTQEQGSERINACKTLECDGLQYTYYINGDPFEIHPPEELGRGSCRTLLSQGRIQMTDFHLTFHRNIEANGEFKCPRTELVFCLGDGIEWGTSLKGGSFDVNTGEMALLHGEGRAEHCSYAEHAAYRFLSIDMSPEQFGRLTGGLSGDRRLAGRRDNGMLFQKHNMNPEIRRILSQIIDCPYGQGVRELYLEGKMLELFAVYLNEAFYESDKVLQAVKLSRDDILGLRAAREILQRDYVNPPTLAGLSRMICLNEFKLKKGFKEMFGITVHAYVIGLRLEHAYFLLAKEHFTVSEAASSVGYGNISHFAAAFRKRFGVSPRECTGSRSFSIDPL